MASRIPINAATGKDTKLAAGVTVARPATAPVIKPYKLWFRFLEPINYHPSDCCKRSCNICVHECK